jgi:uncharacterized protein (TIGR02444 family)
MAHPQRNPLWDFSVRFYRQPDVAPACLSLQDRLGIDVNVLLFCLWTARCGIPLSSTAMKTAVRVSGVWKQRIVGPMREVRRYLKPMNLPGLRRHVVRAELEAERYEQLALRGVLPESLRRGRGSAELAARHFGMYLRLARVRTRTRDAAFLSALIAAAFPPRN